jgi:hypothetical protein
MAEKKPVAFTMKAAERVAAAVRLIENGGRGTGAATGRVNVQSASHFLSKTTAAWAKGTSATLAIYVGTPGSEAATSETLVAFNKFGDVKADRAVLLARCNGGWYLSAADCA